MKPGQVARELHQGSVRGSAAATGGVILRRCVVQVGEPKHLVGEVVPQVSLCCSQLPGRPGSKTTGFLLGS